MLSTFVLRALLPFALLFALLRTMCLCPVCAALRTLLPSMLPTQVSNNLDLFTTWVPKVLAVTLPLPLYLLHNEYRGEVASWHI
ncbi:unnamed protein product [Callosobruchus maculatus]|uniref:Uncharacterized protein n=1 Tax=Callosobruchus maculatus TaxID=64391 RepID=A0A653CW47_CALMS|nr:unnamed protein product [Callosobruchus maculatus]